MPVLFNPKNNHRNRTYNKPIDKVVEVADLKSSNGEIKNAIELKSKVKKNLANAELNGVTKLSVTSKKDYGRKHNQRLLDLIDNPSDIRKLPQRELKKLAQEIRQEMIEVVAKTGGHLGAGLGVVELTIALHYVFDTPQDLLVWDIGHQSYPHKILTGRRKQLFSLRQEGGISGFTLRSESPYDHFGAGHSSTSISAALGMAVAAQQQDQAHRKVLAVIGDGAMSAGLAFEAMNNAGVMKTPLIVILNDNDMSIAPPVGALSDHLSMLMSSKPFLGLRKFSFSFFDFLPKRIKKRLRLTESYVRGLVSGGNFFEQLGFYYIGVVDGHNLDHLISVLRNIAVAEWDGPILLHVVTEKGKGYPPAEKAADKFHGVTEFDVASGAMVKKSVGRGSYTKIFGETLNHLMVDDKKIVAVTAAMPTGTGLDVVQKIYPDRVFDVGIAEQHAVTFAGGMATMGLKPFVAIYSTFLQRAYDQVVHDIAVQNLPVRFILDRAGFVGADGATHHGSFDLPALLTLPNMVMLAPKDGVELQSMLHFMHAYSLGPIAIRFPRGEVPPSIKLLETKVTERIELGRAEVLWQGKTINTTNSVNKIFNRNNNGKTTNAMHISYDRIAIWALGPMVANAAAALELLLARGEDIEHICLVNARFAKPIDAELLRQQVKKGINIFISLEEGSIGGFHSQMIHVLEPYQTSHAVRFYGKYFPDQFLEQGPVNSQLAKAGLSPDKIADFIITLKSAIA